MIIQFTKFLERKKKRWRRNRLAILTRLTKQMKQRKWFIKTRMLSSYLTGDRQWVYYLLSIQFISTSIEQKHGVNKNPTQ